jgi:hypothetical protein
MNIKHRISSLIERAAFSLLSVAANMRGVDAVQVLKASQGMIDDISARKIFIDNEVDVTRVGLARRYDLSMLFNQITNRTMDLKKIEDDRGMGLTGAQLVALKFQQDYLERIAGKSQ